MLQIRLLGQFDVRQDGKRIVISSRAGQSLLAYLAMTAGTPHRREKLAGTLWPESSEENSRKNLRQELWRIRKAIPNQSLSGANDYLLSDDYTITFNPEADYWLDVAILERPDLDPQSLTSNLSLYQGELLPGFYDDWVVFERERIQTLFEAKMERLVDLLVEAERWTAVQEQCERWLALGSTPEPAYRALMLSCSARGDMAKVSAIYQRCVDDLRDRFGVDPSTETHALYNGLLKGSRAPRRVVPAQPSGTVTFLFTDIQGSTRLLDKLGEQYATSLAEHHRILRTAIQKWHGSEMDTQGDAFFVTFARALDAVQCAAEAQRLLAQHTWPLDESVHVRMGLHTGEPLIASTGYVGMDVHRAARIGDAGHGGQVLLSQTTRDLVVQDLPPGLTIRDLGEHRLKDMKYPTPIYQLVIEGLQPNFPALKTKFTGSEPPIPGEPPFKGLQFFEETDSDLFFGRELLTAKLINHLRETKFLSVIIGASGSGKSSLVRAGLIPALKKGSTLFDGTQPLEGSQHWQVFILTPTAHPLEALATQLTRNLDSVAATARLIDDLAQEPRSLTLFLARLDPKCHTVLVVDQFEELFTLCRDEFEREAFIDNLLNLISPDQSNATLIITLRADFYPHIAQYPELRDAVASQQEYIGPMTVDELRRAIEEPAKLGHWEFEQGLVDLILRDVGDEPGALPLLSHALLETWKRRAGHTLTLKGYADAGGVHGAIAQTAESVYQSLSPEDQGIARDIFLRITELGEGTEDTRRRVSFEELTSSSEEPYQVRTVLNKLADARLITLGEETVEVAHEALIREWPTLREWLNQDREGLRLHRHLTEAAYEWKLIGRDTGALYRGAHLSQAREWAALHPNALNAAEREFLAISINQEQLEQQEHEEQQKRELESAQKLAETERARAEEQTHSANRLRMRNRLITSIGAAALILAILAGTFGLQSNRNAREAQTNLGVAEANFRQAEAQRLAAESNKLYLSHGSPEQIALLSLRSMNTQYTPQGDAALLAAMQLPYPRKLFGPHPLGITRLALSPNEKYLLTGGIDKIARMWDVQTGQEVRRFIGHTDVVPSVAFSPDGKFALTASWDKTVRLWEASTGKELHQFLGHTDAVEIAVFSPDGKSILTGGFDKTARLWDVATGQELRQMTQPTSTVWMIAFSPDGKYAITGNDDGTIQLWDFTTGHEIQQFKGHTSAVVALTFSPDGRFILSGSHDQTVRLWDVVTGKEVLIFRGHTNNVNSVAFSPDGRFIFSASLDGTARVWDAKSGNEIQRFTCPAGVDGLAVSSDGSFLYTGSDEVLRIWDLKSKAFQRVFDDGGVLNGLAFSPDGRYVLTGNGKGIARLWDIATGQIVREFIGHTDLINFATVFSPDGRFVLTGSWDGTVRLWDSGTGKEIRQFMGPTTGVQTVAFSPDGEEVIAGALDGVWIWNTETGQEIRQLEGVHRVFRVVFSADGKYIATASGPGDGKARLWDANSGELIRIISDGIDDFMIGVAISRDSRYLLSVSGKIARLWNIQTGKQIRQFAGHTDVLNSGTFSPNGKYIATVAMDSTARLWDVQTGQELRRFVGHTAGVENVIFSPDGKYILTGSDDGTAMLWDVDYHTAMQYLCSHLLRDFTDEERAQYGIMDDAPTCPAKP